MTPRRVTRRRRMVTRSEAALILRPDADRLLRPRQLVEDGQRHQLCFPADGLLSEGGSSASGVRAIGGSVPHQPLFFEVCRPCHGEACAKDLRGGVVDNTVRGLDVLSLLDPLMKCFETGESCWLSQFGAHRLDNVWWERGTRSAGVSQPEQGGDPPRS